MQLIEFFDRGFLVNPEGAAFISRTGGQVVTYREAHELSHRIAAAIRRDGHGDGTAIAVLSHNSPMVLPLVLGIVRSGATWVAVNARSTVWDIATFLQVCGASVLLHSPEMRAAVQEVRRSVPTMELCLESGSGMESWLAPSGTRVPLPPTEPDAVAALFGTGGTTATPKAVEVPHRAFETMIHGFNAHMPEPQPVHLVAAPMTHAAGALVFPVLSLGGTNVVHERVHAAEILDSIAEHRVTRLFLPPTALYALTDEMESRLAGGGQRPDTSSLRYLLYGAAPISVTGLKRAIDAFGPVLAQFYGQVEVPMICTFMSPEEHAAAMANPDLAHRLGSCGRPSTVANLAVMGDDDVPVGPGATGEIVVRSSLVMRGYRGDKEQSEASHRAGWHATGDVGYMDADGYVHLVDRKRDVIISGGFNVFPSEVESVIWDHPGVRDCAVIGIPDAKWGERVTAVVELQPGMGLDREALISACKTRLGSVKAPKEVIVRELPRSAAGKVLRRQLRDEYWAGQPRSV